jgi:hypothetical protein
MICTHKYSQKDLAVLRVSKNETKGILNNEVPYMPAISSKLRVLLCDTVLNGGNPNGGNPS